MCVCVSVRSVYRSISPEDNIIEMPNAMDSKFAKHFSVESLDVTTYFLRKKTGVARVMGDPLKIRSYEFDTNTKTVDKNTAK